MKDAHRLLCHPTCRNHQRARRLSQSYCASSRIHRLAHSIHPDCFVSVYVSLKRNHKDASSSYHPLSNIPFLLLEGYTHLHYFPSVRLIGQQISFSSICLKAAFGTVVQLELKHVDVVRCLHHRIGTPRTSVSVNCPISWKTR